MQNFQKQVFGATTEYNVLFHLACTATSWKFELKVQAFTIYVYICMGTVNAVVQAFAIYICMGSVNAVTKVL